MTQPIAIQSWCFRHFKTIPEFTAQLKAAGVTATEICNRHGNFNDPATFADQLAQYKKAGVQLVAIGVEKLTGNIETDKPRFEFCKQAGVKEMSISFGPEAMFDALRNVEKLCDQYDMTVGIHNHGGYDWLGTPVILKHIFKNTSKRIGLHLDTAWAIDAKQDPIKMAEQFGERLYGVHVKDFVYTRDRQPQDVVIGTGILDLPKFMATLKQLNFKGPLVIEFEGDETNPVPVLKQCVEAMRKLM
jgi:sugar phosphate isomerase/epimerase